MDKQFKRLVVRSPPDLWDFPTPWQHQVLEVLGVAGICQDLRSEMVDWHVQSISQKDGMVGADGTNQFDHN